MKSHPRSHPARNTARIFLALCLLVPCMAFADAEQDWQKITAMDTGPQGEAKSREQAVQLTAKYYDQLEKALRDFITAYPADPHGFEARMRLSHMYAVRGDLLGKPADYAIATKILDDLDASPATPKEKKADIAYARLTMLMHHTVNPDNAARDNVTSHVLKFQKDYPADKRSGVLLAEVASLYDSDPKTKRELLSAAMRYADDAELKQRIQDDFRRLEMLGRPLELKFDSIQGETVNITAYRGKVVLVYFFANWSPPSAQALLELKRIGDAFPQDKFQLIGISLDSKREYLDALVAKTGLKCPLFFDGKGWESPLVRNFGINALPTAWLVDKKGNLRVINAMNDTEKLIQALLKE